MVEPSRLIYGNASQSQARLRATADSRSPFFKIGDVAHLCGVETYVLRFWESQFPQLKPNKSGTGQRLYRRRDVELASRIKRLVHAQGYTLSGARTVLEQGQRRTTKRDDSQGSLPIAADQTRRMDTIGAAIGHARAELRRDCKSARISRQPSRHDAAAGWLPSEQLQARCFRRRIGQEAGRTAGRVQWARPACICAAINAAYSAAAISPASFSGGGGLRQGHSSLPQFLQPGPSH